jgi:hypothetical protein
MGTCANYSLDRMQLNRPTTIGAAGLLAATGVGAYSRETFARGGRADEALRSDLMITDPQNSLVCS